MNIIFMSTPEFGIDALDALNEKYNISAVITQVDKKRGRGKKLLSSPIKERALALGLEVYQPEDINSEESVKYLKSKNADLFVVVAYGQILKEEVLYLPKYYSINIHASLLPKLRGAAPINRAIINGESCTGISIMKMEKGLDTGDVAITDCIEIGKLSASELEKKLAKMGAKLIVEFIEKLKNKNVNFKKQDEELATYAEKIERETGHIDFKKMSVFEIDRLVRGLNDRMYASSVYKGERFKIVEVEISKDIQNKLPGEIIDSNKKLIISAIDGTVSILKLQFPGKKLMDIKSYLAGNSFKVGEILGV
ncbi:MULTISPECIES: methionyl-tRNA formyltransferase [Peptoniphilus]|uniref:methionyl-tRNA formyltransferase n=1 Tax=Peptoniphilus TaxID=162289 RepID=UPI0001DA9C07|nr:MULTISPECIES: methionyl-tRNA formyltransferase [Peptoniphilus]EFI42196.1 methionyl-tRNA formyltransferase [Peptoniphilus sp. oral taxon 386 str. F0131]